MLVVLFAIGVACAGGGPDDLARFLPMDEVVPGWARQGAPRVFARDDLYELVDGQAEAFFAYGLTHAALARYAGPEGTGLRIELFRLASPADAYGLFSTSLSGESVALGAGGDTDPGRRLAFWQERYYARLQTTQPVADEVLLGFGRAVAAALPAGSDLPELVSRLPADGLHSRSARFFRQEISIQPWLWLGGTNLLGLSQETEGVLADYTLGDGTARLLWIRYPDAAAAERALQALQGSTIPNWVMAQVKDTELAAVFGDVGAEEAKELVNRVLK
ncbi:MAG: hypothetical protein DDG58_05950 [Ardenticatenia bacterium]|nr:MAG: hypothetical protein DDG58_05950 [Ardenticatenia bacterium]